MIRSWMFTPSVRTVPSSAGQALKEAASHSTRIDQPYVRKGWLDDPNGRNKRLRGCDEFVPVSSGEAFELAAKELGPCQN